MWKLNLMALIMLAAACSSGPEITRTETEVLVIGGGTGGTAAGIAAARLGAATLIVEEGPWLGGMISAAGVTCTDGNHQMPSGLWGEFREKIYAVYGGPKAVATGWVSMTQFEPHVSDSIWKTMAWAEKQLKVLHGWQFFKTLHRDGKVAGAHFINSAGDSLFVQAKMCIDATELGDALAAAGVPYSLGMEAGPEADEDVGVTSTNDIVQDLTWVATLKDYGPAADCTIVKPAQYNPLEFDGVCKEFYKDSSLPAPSVDAVTMLDYGRLPGNKFMINWPNAGNDAYLNVVELSPRERAKALEAAKQTTLRFVYFIQTELGFKHLGLAHDEFPTDDRLALMPYHREGRRLKGLVRMNIRHIAQPFTYGNALYRTGISVGDYPIDHHHKKNPAAPQHLAFYPVPSYNIPLGALIPKEETGLIAAEKAISVSNVVNGTTRLQPVVILTGQAAGTLAALSVQQSKAPRDVSVRQVQAALLTQKAYIMPYYDVAPADIHFSALQRIGATGLLKGKGEPYKWANRTWFYPDSTISASTFATDATAFSGTTFTAGKGPLSVSGAVDLIFQMLQRNTKAPWSSRFTDAQAMLTETEKQWASWKLGNFAPQRPITRRELAVLLDNTLNPFATVQVDHQGNYLPQ